MILEYFNIKLQSKITASGKQIFHKVYNDGKYSHLLAHNSFHHFESGFLKRMNSTFDKYDDIITPFDEFVCEAYMYVHSNDKLSTKKLIFKLPHSPSTIDAMKGLTVDDSQHFFSIGISYAYENKQFEKRIGISTHKHGFNADRQRIQKLQPEIINNLGDESLSNIFDILITGNPETTNMALMSLGIY